MGVCCTALSYPSADPAGGAAGACRGQKMVEALLAEVGCAASPEVPTARHLRRLARPAPGGHRAAGDQEAPAGARTHWPQTSAPCMPPCQGCICACDATHMGPPCGRCALEQTMN